MVLERVAEADGATSVHLEDGTKVPLTGMGPQGQALFQQIFDLLAAGTSANELVEQYPTLRRSLFGGLEFRELPRLPRWYYLVGWAMALVDLYLGWLLYRAL